MESPKKAELHGDFIKYMFGKLKLEFAVSPCPCVSGPQSKPLQVEATPAVKEKEGELKTWTAKTTAVCHLQI